uniref:Transmembrane protein n=1 Tax=Picea sitchensis TaxID=3332 RepID=B8LLR3_PICSI|nr:unknown [Picea sitchensis]
MGGENGGAEGYKGHSSRLQYYMYSGEKKHVFVGIAVFAAVFSIPWFYMNRGKQHQSHQDYMDKAEKARRERLSTSSSTTN